MMERNMLSTQPNIQIVWHRQPRNRENVEVSSTACGLHWPDLDEDSSIDGIIGV